MPLAHIITKCRESKAYFRGLVVRAIEDAVILLILGTGTWAVCWLLGGILKGLGVA